MDYSRNAITIYSDTYDSELLEKVAQTTYDGITSYEQAYREGMYQLYSNQRQLRTVSFEANIDAIACTVGDVILVAHDVPKWAYSGRIESVNVDENSLLLPVDIDVEAGTYRIMFRTQKDTLQTISVSRIEKVADGYSKVYLASALDRNDLPQKHDVFDIALQNIGSKPFIVKSISRAKDFTRHIECLEYDENVYSGNYSVPPIDYSVIDTKVENVENVSAKQTKSVNDNGDIEYRLEISWEYDKNAVFDIYASYDNEEYTLLANGVKTRAYFTLMQSELSSVKIVTRNSIRVSSGVVAEIVSVDESYIPNAPTNINITLLENFHVSWSKVTNVTVKHYEVRTNTDVGNDNGLIAVTNDYACFTNSVAGRTGTIYVYAVSETGKYSAPAVKTYSFATPVAPTFTVDSALKTVYLSYSNKPNYCYGIKYNLVGASHSYEIITSEIIKVIPVEADIYDVKARYIDYFGVGLESVKSVTVKATIDSVWLANESVTNEKLDNAVKNTISKLQTDVSGLKTDLGALDGLGELVNKVDDIQAVITQLENQDFSAYMQKAEAPTYINTTLASWGLLNNDKTLVNVYTKTETSTQITSALTTFRNNTLVNYSTITQLNDAIGLCVATTDYTGNNIISKINLGSGTVAIEGKYVHITGDTVFDNNVITNGMLQAGAVTADKMDVTSLSAISATIGTLRTATSGARLEITDNLIISYDSNNKVRVRFGAW